MKTLIATLVVLAGSAQAHQFPGQPSWAQEVFAPKQ
jgi:hypothetical protein